MKSLIQVINEKLKLSDVKIDISDVKTDNYNYHHDKFYLDLLKK